MEERKMKLKTYKFVKKGEYTEKKEEYIDVGFWSFMKCAFLTQLALTGIVYGIIIVCLFFIGICALFLGL